MTTTPRRAVVALSLAVAASVLLAGCASGDAEASDTTQTPSAPSSATASPAETSVESPASTPTPSDGLEDPASWVVSFDGVGPVAIGGSLQEFRADQDALDDVSTDACVVGMFELPDGPAVWASPAADDDTIDTVTYGAALLGAQQASGAGGPETEEGIGLGATLADLESAYPDLAEQPNDSGTWPVDFAITDGQGSWIVFGLKDDVVDSITVGDEPVTPLEFCG